MPNAKEYRITKWISIIHRKTQIYLNQELKPIGLNATEGVYLMHLATKPSVAQAVLSEHLGLDGALTTRTLRGLEERELVSRARDPQDSRCYHVSITEKGLAILPTIRNVMENWRSELVSDLSDGELVQLSATLEKLARHTIELTKPNKNKSDPNPTTKGCDCHDR